MCASNNNRHEDSQDDIGKYSGLTPLRGGSAYRPHMEVEIQKKILSRSLKYLILILDKFIGIDPVVVPSKTDRIGKNSGKLLLAPEQSRGMKMEKTRVRKQTL